MRKAIIASPMLLLCIQLRFKKKMQNFTLKKKVKVSIYNAVSSNSD